MTRDREEGMVAVELVANLLLLALIAIGELQAAAAGQAAVAARNAARAASREASLGGDQGAIERAADAAVPPSLRTVTLVESVSGARVTVSVGVPLVLPGLPKDSVSIDRTVEMPTP